MVNCCSEVSRAASTWVSWKACYAWGQLPWEKSKSLRPPRCEEAQVSHGEKPCWKRDPWLANGSSHPSSDVRDRDGKAFRWLQSHPFYYCHFRRDPSREPPSWTQLISRTIKDYNKWSLQIIKLLGWFLT